MMKKFNQLDFFCKDMWKIKDYENALIDYSMIPKTEQKFTIGS